MWIRCPKCGEQVNFLKQVEELFEEDGESRFKPEQGVIFHTITCDCGAEWCMSLSGVLEKVDVNYEEKEEQSPVVESVVVGPNTKFKVIIEELGDALGYTDFNKQIIGLDKSLTPTAQHHVILHELIHIAVEKMLVGNLLTKDEAPSEKAVTYLTGALFPMLVYSGLYKGVSIEEINEFLKTELYKEKQEE